MEKLVWKCFEIISTTGGTDAIVIAIIVVHVIVDEWIIEGRLSISVCTLGEIGWQKCGGWLHHKWRRRTNQEAPKVIQVKNNKGTIRMVIQVTRKKARYIAETLFNFLFIEKWTEYPLCSWTQSSQEAIGIETQSRLCKYLGSEVRSKKGSLTLPVLSISKPWYQQNGEGTSWVIGA